jgi:hypothetical protein
VRSSVSEKWLIIMALRRWADEMSDGYGDDMYRLAADRIERDDHHVVPRCTTAPRGPEESQVMTEEKCPQGEADVGWYWVRNPDAQDPSWHPREFVRMPTGWYGWSGCHRGDAPQEVGPRILPPYTIHSGPSYVASRASIPERGAMWRVLRGEGYSITSSWIDEDGEGETADLPELWGRIHDEISRSERLVLFAESGDFPLRGALIEVGMALGMGIPVVACLPGVEFSHPSFRPVGSWINHPLVHLAAHVRLALTMSLPSPVAPPVRGGKP